MKFINQYMKYVYIILAVALIVMVIRLLLRLRKTGAIVNDLSLSSISLSNGLNAAKEKSDKIALSSDSWSFFTTIYLLASLTRQADRYRKKGNSVPKAVSETVLKNVSKISKIRI